jgi:hypothetical protein
MIMRRGPASPLGALRTSARRSDADYVEKTSDLDENLSLLLSGDNSVIPYFDQFFSLPEGRSFSRCESLSQMFELVFVLFFNPDSDELTFQALRLLSLVFTFDFDISALVTPDFLRAVVCLLSHANKALSHYSLLSILNLLLSNGVPWSAFSELDLLSQLFFAVPPEDCQLHIPNLTVVGEVLLAVLSQELSVSESLHVYQHSLRLIEGSFAELGFAIMRQLLELKFEIDVTDEMRRGFLGLVIAPGRILDQFFAFVSQLPDRDDIVDWLMSEGFFTDLMERIVSIGDFEIGEFVFKILGIVEFRPPPDDPIVGVTIELAKQGNVKTKMAVIRYLNELLVDDTGPFALVLIEGGVVQVIADVLDSGIREMTRECLDMLSRLAQAATLQDVNFCHALGFEDLVGVLRDFEGEFDGVYIHLIELIQYEHISGEGGF